MAAKGKIRKGVLLVIQILLTKRLLRSGWFAHSFFLQELGSRYVFKLEIRSQRIDMSLPEDFWKQLPLKTDAELYDILSHQDDYLPEAVAAAKDELSKRKLTPERAAEVEAAVHSQNVAARKKAEERLSWPMRIFVFVFCGGMAGGILAVYYQHKGYKQKASDCWVTVGVSVAVHVLLGILLSQF